MSINTLLVEAVASNGLVRKHEVRWSAEAYDPRSIVNGLCEGYCALPAEETEDDNKTAFIGAAYAALQTADRIKRSALPTSEIRRKATIALQMGYELAKLQDRQPYLANFPVGFLNKAALEESADRESRSITSACLSFAICKFAERGSALQIAAQTMADLYADHSELLNALELRLADQSSTAEFAEVASSLFPEMGRSYEPEKDQEDNDGESTEGSDAGDQSAGAGGAAGGEPTDSSDAGDQSAGAGGAAGGEPKDGSDAGDQSAGAGGAAGGEPTDSSDAGDQSAGAGGATGEVDVFAAKPGKQELQQEDQTLFEHLVQADPHQQGLNPFQCESIFGDTKLDAKPVRALHYSVDFQLINAIQRVFSDIQRRRKLKLTSGNGITAKDFWRYSMVGDTRIFNRRCDVEGMEMAFSMLLDTSGSMKKFIEDVIKVAYAFQLGLSRVTGIRTSISLFSDHPCAALKFNQHFKSAENILRSAKASGNTYMGRALNASINEILKQTERKKVICILTDGEPSDASEFRSALQRAKTSGIEVYGIGFGGKKSKIRSFVNDSIDANDVKELKAKLPKLLDRIAG